MRIIFSRRICVPPPKALNSDCYSIRIRSFDALSTEPTLVFEHGYNSCEIGFTPSDFDLPQQQKMNGTPVSECLSMTSR
jgi:hypothetical protein